MKLWSVLGCLRQPGLLLNQHHKSMRVKSSQLINFCGTWTDPATKTKSIGLLAYAQLSWFLNATSYTTSFLKR